MRQIGMALGGGSYLEAGQRKFVLSMIDLDAAEPDPALLPLDFLAHGLAFDPRDRSRAAVFEKQGKGACLVDVARGRTLQPIATTPSRKFYGHGAFSADGSLLYATESIVDRAFEGVLVARDARTLRELGAVPTHGASPHDCQLIDGGRTMVVANGGGPFDGGEPGSVTFVELASGKLLDRITIASPRFNAGHVTVGPSGDLAVVSAPRDGLPSPGTRPGAVTLRARGAPARLVDGPPHAVARMLGETLSVLVDEGRGVALATHPLGNCVSCWKLADASLVALLELDDPRGIVGAPDGRSFLVSHVQGRSVRLTEFMAETLAPTGFFVDPSFISGSHVFILAPPGAS